MASIVIAGLLASFLSYAPAESDVAAASEAFRLAQRAELAKDFERAAEFYELADSLDPSDASLRSATKMRFAAGQHAAAGTSALALRRRYPDSGKSERLAALVLSKVKTELGRFDVRCDRPCVLASDNAAVSTERSLSHDVFLAPGSHDLTASFDSGVTSVETVAVTAGQKGALSFVRPASDDDLEPTEPAMVAPWDRKAEQDDGPRSANGRQRLSPIWFAVGATATVGLGAGALASGLITLQRKDTFDESPTQARLDDGQRLQLQTNVLIGVTAAVAVGTTVIAVFTDWGRPRRNRKTARIRWTGMGASF